MSAREKPAGNACPICGKETAVRYKPFCSKRCADIDLNRWLSGRYAIPAAEEDMPDEEDAGMAGPAKDGDAG